jgi:hypothetical protein
MSEEESEAIYEMLWDCKYCGQTRNLGLTHRFCANCGSPQDPAARYFPPEGDEVAVEDHPFVGADVYCPACRTPMGAAAAHCSNCGSPLDGAAEVQTQADQVDAHPEDDAAPPPAPPTAPIKRSTIILVVAAALGAIVITGAIMAAFWKHEGVFVVTSQTWQRAIEVQRFEPTRKSVWCDEIPGGARELSRKKEQRGTTKVPDGETCQTRKKDLGNGTFKEVKECTPKTKDTPNMSDRCDVELTEWHTQRTLTANGTADEPVRWPDVTLGKTGTCAGCEREGPRTEKYTVNFSDSSNGKDAHCDFTNEVRWAPFEKGSKWKGKARVVTGGIDCDGLVRP